MLINNWAHTKIEFCLCFEAVCANYKKANKQVQGKFCNVNRDHGYKIARKQGYTCTTVDILLGV